MDTIAETAVILCGGKARRLGTLGERLPKSLAVVRGKPILWYILLRLHLAGFRRFVLPLGHLGDAIRKFVEGEVRGLGASVEMIETGDDSSVGHRLSLVKQAIAGDNLLLINGDTLFDFDVAGLMSKHLVSGAELTLTSCHITSQYGLMLVEQSGRIVDFVGNAVVDEVVVDGRDGLRGFINAGIAVLGRHTLDFPGIDAAVEFEHFLYPRIVACGKARSYVIDGFWFAIDTQKDLEIANASSDHDPRAVGSRLLEEKLSAYASKIYASR